MVCIEKLLARKKSSNLLQGPELRRVTNPNNDRLRMNFCSPIDPLFCMMKSDYCCVNKTKGYAISRVERNRASIETCAWHSHGLLVILPSCLGIAAFLIRDRTMDDSFE